MNKKPQGDKATTPNLLDTLKKNGMSEEEARTWFTSFSEIKTQIDAVLVAGDVEFANLLTAHIYKHLSRLFCLPSFKSDRISVIMACAMAQKSTALITELLQSPDQREWIAKESRYYRAWPILKSPKPEYSTNDKAIFNKLKLGQCHTGILRANQKFQPDTPLYALSESIYMIIKDLAVRVAASQNRVSKGENATALEKAFTVRLIPLSDYEAFLKMLPDLPPLGSCSFSGDLKSLRGLIKSFLDHAIPPDQFKMEYNNGNAFSEYKAVCYLNSISEPKTAGKWRDEIKKRIVSCVERIATRDETIG